MRLPSKNTFQTFPIHPILYATIGYIVGITVAMGEINIALLLYCFLACAGLLYAIAIEHDIQLSKYHKQFALFFFAITSGILLSQYQILNHQKLRQALIGLKWQCTGIIASIEPLARGTWRYRTLCNCQEITTAAQKFKTHKQVIIFTKEKPQCQPGDLVTAHDLYCQPTTNNKYELYLLKEGIAASVFCGNPRISIEQQQAQPWRNWVQHRKLAIINTLRNKMPKTTYALWSSLLLGYKDTPKDALKHIKQNFKYWGISHYLARSAMHVIIFLGLFLWVLKQLPINYFIKELITTFLLGGYFLLSWTGISFTRSCIIFCLYKICIFLNLQIRPLYLLLLTTLSVLLINPAQFWFLDFQLSFGLTCALAWYSELLNAQHNS